MADHSKILPRPLFQRDVNWDPFHDRTQPSRIFEQDFGLPPFLEPGDVNWINWARQRLAASSWPGYLRSSLFTPSGGVTSPPPPPVTPGGISEVRTGPDSWKIGLDVKHFSPEEITIKTKEGYLEIAGKHEERQDEHGFVSRCFTRKYKLPPGVDLQHISSSLSRDGMLTVEAPLPLPAPVLPPEIVIPIQVEQAEDECPAKERGDKGEKREDASRDVNEGNSDKIPPPAGEEKQGNVLAEVKPKTRALTETLSHLK